MSRITYENYGNLASRLSNATLIAGRYGSQKEAERRIVADVYQKLNLEPDDSLLEIGCNVGNLLVPLSFVVNRCSGIDHPACIRADSEPVTWMPISTSLREISLISS